MTKQSQIVSVVTLVRCLATVLFVLDINLHSCGTNSRSPNYFNLKQTNMGISNKSMRHSRENTGLQMLKLPGLTLKTGDVSKARQ